MISLNFLKQLIRKILAFYLVFSLNRTLANSLKNCIVNNYGLAVIIFTVLVRLVLLPLDIKSKKSMLKTSRLGPKLKEIEKRCGEDKLKYQQEMSALYKKEGVSPTGGCLWSFIPLLILIPLYTIVREPITYILGESKEVTAQIIEAIKAVRSIRF